MSFAPFIPASGLVGWNFLARTQVAQKQVLEQTPQFSREAEIFRERIRSVQTATDLISDPILLRVSLGAFGLSDDAGNTFFIKKVLEDGSLDSDALANKLADKRYLEFSRAFGFGPGELLQVQRSNFAEQILAKSLDNSFEIAVGEQDPNLRLALSLEQSLSDIAESSSSNTAKWFTIMGTPTVRTVFEGALSLPSALGTLDIDKQLEVFQTRSQSVFGTSEISDFGSSDLRDDLTRKFLLQQEVSNIMIASSASNALTLLQTAF